MDATRAQESIDLIDKGKETAAMVEKRGRFTQDFVDECKSTAMALFMIQGDTSFYQDGTYIKGPGHISCAQAVYMFSLLLQREDPRTSRIAFYLGGGVSRMGLVCGALTGAALALGDQDYRQPSSRGQVHNEEIFLTIQKLVQDFRQKFGSTECAQLSCDLLTDEGRDRFFQNQWGLTNCSRYVDWACDQLVTLLDSPTSATS